MIVFVIYNEVYSFKFPMFNYSSAVLCMLFRASINIFIPGGPNDVTKITNSPFSEVKFLKTLNCEGPMSLASAAASYRKIR